MCYFSLVKILMVSRIISLDTARRTATSHVARKPHIQLSKRGFAWLADKLQETFARHGKITISDIEKSD